VQNANAILKFNAAAAIKFSSLSIRFQRRATSHAQLAPCGTKYSRAICRRAVKFHRRVAPNLKAQPLSYCDESLCATRLIDALGGKIRSKLGVKFALNFKLAMLRG